MYVYICDLCTFRKVEHLSNILILSYVESKFRRSLEEILKLKYFNELGFVRIKVKTHVFKFHNFIIYSLYCRIPEK